MDIFFGNAGRRFYDGSPLTLVDVGARGGVQPNWRAALEHLRVIGFEPDPVEHARLARSADPARRLYINAAVADGKGRKTLNVGRDGGTSSLLPPNLAFLRRFPDPQRYEVTRRVEVDVDCLDALLPQHGVERPDFIKIDAQGAEFPILQGARNTLTRSVFGAEVEVLFAPLYEGHDGFGRVDDFMRSLGFHLFDVRPSYWKRAAGAPFGGSKGQLVFGDALYLKTEDAFAAQLAAAGEMRAATLIHALSICALYGYLDYALELLAESGTALPKDVAAAVEGALRSDVRFSTRLPHFRGRGWLSHLFYRLHRALFPTVGGWASGGRHLGNVD